MALSKQRHNPSLNPVRSAHWTPRDEAAGRRDSTCAQSAKPIVRSWCQPPRQWSAEHAQPVADNLHRPYRVGVLLMQFHNLAVLARFRKQPPMPASNQLAHVGVVRVVLTTPNIYVNRTLRRHRFVVHLLPFSGARPVTPALERTCSVHRTIFTPLGASTITGIVSNGRPLQSSRHFAQLVHIPPFGWWLLFSGLFIAVLSCCRCGMPSFQLLSGFRCCSDDG